VIEVRSGDEITYRKAARALSGQRTGEVVRVTNRYVFVWAGGKKPAQVPRDRIVNVRARGRPPMSDSIRLDVIERVMSEYAETIGRAVEEQTQFVMEQLNPAEAALVSAGLALHSVDELRDTGALREAPSVLDATNRQLKAVAAVWAVVNRWDCSFDLDRRLVDELKVMPAEDAEAVVELLRSGGLLPT